ncbi:MAG: chromosomal replication initiator protein DnaA [Solirubrobacteraceae bacterium]
MELPAQLEPDPAWREIRAQVRQAVGDSTFDIWIAPLEVKAWEGNVLVIEAPRATRAWVAKRFGRILESCASTVVGHETRVSFADEAPASAPSSVTRPADTSSLNPRYSFEQFIIGDANRLAHAASLAVAELPGQAYNPLFLHAPPGLGKTHLLHAIGNYVLAFGGGASIRYTTVETFTNHFISALTTRSTDRFKHAYRDADVLLIDDVQFLASKAKTEEEFFHTFNALYENGRQLVLTCDRLPRQLTTVEERLRERFESGLVADIKPPDFSTRVAILRKRAAIDHIPLRDPTVLDLIAETITDNIRALEGALIRIVAHHSLTGRPIDVELATSVLDHMYPPTQAAGPTLENIKAVIASHYEISVAELISSSRTGRIAWPRQLAIHAARELTGQSLQSIGSAFGGRNHATVLHACRRVAERARTDPESAAEVERLLAALRTRQRDREY